MEGPSIEEVMKMDAEFQAAASASALDPTIEATALREIFEGASRDLVETACKKTLNAERWGKCRESWGAWQSDEQQSLGPAVKAVIEDLEAEHLRPSGILQRLQQGVDPACHGLCALMGHLDSKRPLA
eukprot:CAMPEP_0173095138 /NCGR_PEP_ID=MMETSP1102-20130122/31634_1 /TAXON_ID=49646 /ORGANISM="Geminigera sp., Strain Caron Lab Isolate" /LENGTH=127 /DNA_ID=CAMNT_0013984741 /DNA_START=1 /DNA_END=384 /DNA_ORIENTATION=+